MLYFSKLRILFITLISLLFIAIASSNLIKLDDDFFDKKINLGLDLQGGSYLLLEIDNAPVIEQKLQNLTTTIRNYFKEKVYKTVIPRNVRLSEAPSHGLPCVVYDKSCLGSKSYFKLLAQMALIT